MAELSDREIDALFAGRSNVTGDDLNELVLAAKAAGNQPLDEAIEQRHLAAIIESQLTTANQPGFAPRTRRDKMRKIFRPAWVKAIAVLGVALAATTGLASAGVMPAPAQDVLSEVAEKVGFDIPASDNAGKKDNPDGTEDDAGEEGDDAGTAGAENGKSVADDVHAVLEDDSLEGREKGDAVSDAASQNRQNETHSHSWVGGPPAELPGGNPND